MTVMINHLINDDALKDWLGCKNRPSLEKILQNHGIRIIHGKGGKLCTTLDAINKGLGINQQNIDDDDFL